MYIGTNHLAYAFPKNVALAAVAATPEFLIGKTFILVMAAKREVSKDKVLIPS